MNYEYEGAELELFRHAHNWKNYYARMIRPFFGAEVLEVGAGLGATTEHLCTNAQKRWVCLEPDAAMADAVARKIANGELPAQCETRVATLADLDENEKFDSILYIDVLEHIADDAAEARRAAAHLADNGHLIVLAPAHQFLFTPFDRAIGHHRRYSTKSLAAAIPPELKQIKLCYLDSIGAFASLGNKFFLRKSMPNLNQILLWDKRLVPLSRVVDSLLSFRAGKSVLGIWQKTV